MDFLIGTAETERDVRRIFEFGSFYLDTSECRLYRDGETVPLTPKFFDILIVLVERNGRLVEKERLMQIVWPDTYVEEGNYSFLLMGVQVRWRFAVFFCRVGDRKKAGEICARPTSSIKVYSRESTPSLMSQDIDLVITQTFARYALTSSSRSDGMSLAVRFNALSLPKFLLETRVSNPSPRMRAAE
jgi:hypothetical protein